MSAETPGVALRRGCRQAFASWIDRLQPRVLGYARRKLGNLEDALDVVQETFVAAFAGRDGMPEPEPQQASWLLGIASHKVHDHLRRRYRRNEAVLGDRHVATGDTAREAEGRLERSRVLAALDGIDEPFREALLLASVEELSYAEVAAAQGCPVGTVRSRIAKARQLLRARLAGSGGVA